MRHLPLYSAMIAMIFAQILKVFIQRGRVKYWDWNILFQTGGMPSSHSAMVSALAVKMLLLYGWASPWFAVSFILAIIVMYDAIGVRRQAGEMAMILEECIYGAATDSPIKSTAATGLRHWRRKGHTPLEVVGGAILGTGIAWLI
jgi:acid phosphatase family membrane protein YuiD